MYRGVSFPIGGDGNLSYTVTIPSESIQVLGGYDFVAHSQP